MTRLLLISIFLWGAPAVAATKDRDSGRTVDEGTTAYTGARLAVGARAEAFVLQYQGHNDWKVSPSRYAVDFNTAKFQFRNRSQYPLTAAQMGVWMRAGFVVVSVAETPVEQPAGSGNWGWALTYECDLQSLVVAGR